MIKVSKCKFCGRTPRISHVSYLNIHEYKVSCWLSCKNNRACEGNWYETKRMAIIDWNRFRCKGKDGLIPRRNNYFLRNYEMYWSNGDKK